MIEKLTRVDAHIYGGEHLSMAQPQTILRRDYDRQRAITNSELCAFLRSAAAAGDCHPAYVEAMEKAADEIERLQAALT